ncbi:MAG: AmmeMemoRadiSam system radical SAM enzyme [Kiritimatiellia bacterium]
MLSHVRPTKHNEQRTTNSPNVSRRDFIRAATAAGLSVPALTASAALPSTPELREARHYMKLGNNMVRCTLCPWQCMVAPGKRGNCGVRENRNGRYYTLVYGHPCSRHNDPIEKKPLFHVYPGSMAYSIATVGCNIHCKFCQNWEISQYQKSHPDKVADFPFVSPDQIAQSAARHNSKTVAYTYSEPTIFYEYMMDCAKAARERGIGNVVISNGFISKEPLRKLCEVMTAVKIDLKAFSQQFYAGLCGGLMKPVLDTLKTLADSGIWFEIVVLVIPTKNDGAEEIKRMAGWIVENLGADVPLHFTRFHPTYKITNLPATPPRTLALARETAMKQGCRFVYTGNLPGAEAETTFCPECRRPVIKRHGMMTLSEDLKEGRCPHCAAVIPGVWA